MSAGRFKSKDDYFTRKSGLAERVISIKPQKVRRRSVESSVPATLLRVHFCKTVDEFEIEGKGRFMKGEYPLDDAIASHLDGDMTVLVNPLSHSGETAFTVVRFDLSEEMDHPFSCARRFADELGAFSIPCLIEVTEGGKGHYHLWIFHEEPVPAWQFSEALMKLGGSLFNMMLETIPSVRGDEFMPLPLQGESMLLQRRVFVNAVGKMIRDQANVLRTLEYCPRRTSSAFIEHMSRTAGKQAPQQKAREIREEKPVQATISPPSPAPDATPVTMPQRPPVTAPPVQARTVTPPAVQAAPVSRERVPEPTPIPKDRPFQISPASASSPVEKPVHGSDREPTVAGIPSVKASDPAPSVKPVVSTPAADSEKTGPVPRPEAPLTAVAVPVVEVSPAVERAEVSPERIPTEIAPERFLLFQRGGAEYGVPARIAFRVAKLGDGDAVNGGPIRIGGENIMLVDTASSDTNNELSVSGTCFAVVLTGDYRGFALAADRISGISMLVKSPDSLHNAAMREFKSADGTRRVSVPDLDFLFGAAEKRAIRSAAAAGSLTMFGGTYLILSAKDTLYAIPAEKVKHVLPSDARDTNEMINAAGLSPELSSGDKRAAKSAHLRKIVMEGKDGPVMVMAERVLGLKKIDSDSMMDPSVDIKKLHPACAASFTADGKRILVLDPGYAGR